ncbi:MAG: PLP-dependent aminotransferase family protein [Oscillospiraceae bacterium]|nr:PLP-dependent aminotransferase family protein [Oscillospiraceae bacterium]
MLTYHLDPQLKTPLYEQLYRAIRADILAGVLPEDSRLPAKRPFAEHLEISRITVESAYAQLLAEGYVYSVPRSGIFVQKLERISQPSVKAAALSAPCEEAVVRPDYDFDTGAVDTDCFPFTMWAKFSRAVLTEYESRILLSSAPQGAPALRQEIARYLHDFRGITVDPEQIIVGAGSEYLVTLIIQLLGRTRTYALENPCYPKLEQIFAASDAQTTFLPLDDAGISMDALEQADASVVYLTPSHHFPLGVVTSAARRMALLRWASEGEGRYLIEDDYDSEFRFASRPIPALKEQDAQDRVIYLNTFAKSLAPSLRIGYVVLPQKLLQEFRRRFSAYSSTVPAFEQYTLARFMETGTLDRQINRLRTVYRARRDRLLEALAASDLAGRYTVSGIEAGLHLLLQVHGISEDELVRRAAQNGCRVHGLSEYYVADTQHDCPPSTVLLGYGGMTDKQIEKGVKRLAEAWRME